MTATHITLARDNHNKACGAAPCGPPVGNPSPKSSLERLLSPPEPRQREGEYQGTPEGTLWESPGASATAIHVKQLFIV